MVCMGCNDHRTTSSVRRGISVGACENCASVRFVGPSRGADEWDAISAIFGEYELAGRVDTIRAPAGEVLAYRARRPADRAALSVTPPHRWFNVNEHLWMCHDGEVLLLAHRWASVSRLMGA